MTVEVDRIRGSGAMLQLAFSTMSIPVRSHVADLNGWHALVVDSHPHVTLLAQDLASVPLDFGLPYKASSANWDTLPHRPRYGVAPEV
jgi:hypothetical protein